MTLTEKDEVLLKYIKDKASELGYMPLISDVPESGKIKGRFRCWKDALKALVCHRNANLIRLQSEWLREQSR